MKSASQLSLDLKSIDGLLPKQKLAALERIRMGIYNIERAAARDFSISLEEIRFARKLIPTVERKIESTKRVLGRI